MPLMTFESTMLSDILSPICVFGTNIESASSKDSLGFTWKAFKWATTADDSFTEEQTVECTIKLTRDDPNQTTKKCDPDVPYERK